MAKQPRRRFGDDEGSTVESPLVPVPAPKPRVTEPQAPPPPQPKVQIRNLRDQLTECSVLSEDGSSVPVRLMARGVSTPYYETQIDAYTRGLADRGILKIEPAR